MPEIADVLVRITERRRQRLLADERTLAAPDPPKDEPNALLQALSQEQGPAIIAEIKMGSPKLGSLAGRFDPERQARTYAEAGAAALSVVVEPDFFGGSYELLHRCREASGLPALAKDFVVDERQIAWAAEAGASAVLLIAALYSREELLSWAARVRRYSLVPLIETHDPEDIAKLGTSKLTSGEWELVGVNNRDLRTFEVDLEHSIGILPVLPAGAIKVAESGLHRHEDIARLHDAGFDAFLIGEALLLAERPEAKLAELLGR